MQREPFRLYVLCFDTLMEQVVAAIGDEALVAIPLAKLLAAEPDFAAVRHTRSKVEFYFTATPVLTRYCLRREPTAETITYLDADLFFFGPASAVFSELGAASVGIVPHRFPPRIADRARHGTYNVGWVSFRRDADGLACLEWWRERCLEWCHDRVEGNRFADQGYLDEFPRRFRNVRPLEHPGINAAPWNIADLKLTSEGGRLQVAGQPLLFYHYQGIREVEPGWFDPSLGTYRTPLTSALRDMIYLPYLRRLRAMQVRLQREHGIQPVIGYLRLPTDVSLRSRWQRFRAGRLMLAVRKLRRGLIHCPDAMP